MRKPIDEFHQQVEGIIYSYKQHLATLENVETERRRNTHDLAALDVELTFKEKYNGTNEMDRAMLLKRLFGEENVWVSSVGDDTLTITQKL